MRGVTVRGHGGCSGRLETCCCLDCVSQFSLPTSYTAFVGGSSAWPFGGLHGLSVIRVMSIPFFKSSLPPYHLRQTQHRVEAWSIARLPFAPKDWLKDFRQHLRTSVRQLRAHHDQLLHAVYASPVRELCDPENVLLYNVGSSYFAEATRYGLRFERAFHIEAPCPQALAGQALHYHDYRIAPFSSDPHYWKMGKTLATWSFVSDAQGSKSCAATWYAMKRGQIATFPSEQTVPQEYGLRLQLNVPIGVRVRLAEVVKPLFDGVISALHYHDRTDQAELSRRVANTLGVRVEEISALLQAKTATILGKRRLLHRFRDNVQWNPQDDSCFVGELRVSEGNYPAWTISGEIVEVSAG